MLIALMPEQISRRWELIKYAVEQAVPPTVLASPEVLNNLLMSLLDGSAQCWVNYKKKEDKSTVDAVLVTTIIEDFLSRTRNLLLYALYGASPLDDESYASGFETLKKYARANSCVKMVAYTNNSRVIEVASRVGWDVEWNFISFTL